MTPGPGIELWPHWCHCSLHYVKISWKRHRNKKCLCARRPLGVSSNPPPVSMSQGTNTTWPGLTESSQYLPLTKLSPSLALISEQYSAGISWMEPRGTVKLQTFVQIQVSCKLQVATLNKLGLQWELFHQIKYIQCVIAFYRGSSVWYHQSSSGTPLQQPVRKTRNIRISLHVIMKYVARRVPLSTC